MRGIIPYQFSILQEARQQDVGQQDARRQEICTKKKEAGHRTTRHKTRLKRQLCENVAKLFALCDKNQELRRHEELHEHKEEGRRRQDNRKQDAIIAKRNHSASPREIKRQHSSRKTQ